VDAQDARPDNISAQRLAPSACLRLGIFVGKFKPSGEEKDDMASATPNKEPKSKREASLVQSHQLETAIKMLLESGLYLVATPIGNLGDFTPRGAKTLTDCDLILAEDTRVTKRLMGLHGISGKVVRCDEAATQAGLAQALRVLEKGGAVAFCSDAGTPGVSDPGERLARGVIEAGYRVLAIPGASAALAALIVSGLPSARFFFAGFAPSKAGARADFFHECAAIPATLIFYETGPRLAESLAAMAKVFGDRPACVARELTKVYEETVRGTLSDLAQRYGASDAPRGEIVVVVGGKNLHTANAQVPDLDGALQEALSRLSVKDAAAAVALTTGIARRDVYSRALALVAARKQVAS
jgi:16S rRNA (cytidine1402-2'-O)-methyltransferase